MTDATPNNESPVAASDAVAPHPGSPAMPRWDMGELPAAPAFTFKSWALLLGPGLVMGGAAIGGGEWLAGPLTTARYGGAILWLATVSILGQVVYNLEISRYTLYCGEPIFTGKFRLLPGPLFWLVVYLFLDFGSVLPYLVASAATPLAAVILGKVPIETDVYTVLGRQLTGAELISILKYVAFFIVLLPMIFGGKAYNAMKTIMNVKIVVVLGFLLLVAACYSTSDTWYDIVTGFFKFGSVPIVGDDPAAPPVIDNFFVALWQGRPIPDVEWEMIAVLGALAAVSGNGGLTNTTISAYTREQGWGMGAQVGAVPSVFGDRDLKLSHTGMVFPITAESVRRFRRWFQVVLRDQLVVWMPACFVGVALPSMLSVQFLPRNTVASQWTAAGMTADGLRDAVGPTFGQYFWWMSLFCGFLVLAPSATNLVDGVIRRWVDVCWTALPSLRRWDPHRIRGLYFGALCAYAVFGTFMLSLGNPVQLLSWATNIYNAALGFSCFHVLAVNTILLPRELRPNWFLRIGLVLAGLFFLSLSTLATLKLLGRI
jgi:hypothetical protein